MTQYDGEMPADYDKLKRLAGIGPYTAGAICSIAFGLPTPAVDGQCVARGDETLWPGMGHRSANDKKTSV